MNILKALAFGFFAMAMPLQADALTIRFQDLVDPANLLVIDDGDALDVADENTYLNRIYLDRLVLAPFSFGGFDFLHSTVQGDDYRYVGVFDPYDRIYNRLMGRFAGSGNGLIQISVTGLMDLSRIGSPSYGFGHERNLNPNLDVSMATYLGESAFDTSTLFASTAFDGFMPSRSRFPLRNAGSSTEASVTNPYEYWATHVITLSGSGQFDVSANHRFGIGEVPLPFSATALLAGLGLLGGLKLRRKAS